MSKLSRFLRRRRVTPREDLSRDFMSVPVGFSGPADSPLEAVFRDHDGRVTRKWQHYLGIYDEEVARFRGQAPRLLEIGVENGGSLQIWRKYFGADAIIFGIEINPGGAALDTPDLPVRIGSQDDAAFLDAVVSEMGGLDIVIDDGSHLGRHQIASFEALFPRLSDGGLYVIEDLHAAYWANFEGGLGRDGTMIAFTKDMIDDMHGWYHSQGVKAFAAARTEIARISVYDSMIAIRKTRREPPREVLTGVVRRA